MSFWRVDDAGRVQPWTPSAATVAAQAQRFELLDVDDDLSEAALASPKPTSAMAFASPARSSTSPARSSSSPESTRSNGGLKKKAKPASSTERGRKFRQKLQTRELNARAEIEALRQQIVKMEAAKERCESSRALTTPFSGTCSPLQFVQEYFRLFHHGVRLPRSLVGYSAEMGAVPIDSSKHEAFLSACTAPDVQFDKFVGITPMIDQWRRYSTVHPFLRLEPVSAELQMQDNRAAVVAKGVLHIRYSRRTVEAVFPHILADEDLVQRLIGRLVHMHYTSHYFFDERGLLVNQQIVPDYVSALKEVLGNLDDVARVLGQALLREHVLGRIAYKEYDSDHDESSRPVESPNRPAGMELDYILS